jgi:menaquinone-dependent protoporphyrinogen IX oxidase
MILVAYASKQEATEGIAHHIARTLSEAGKDAEARSVTEIDDLGAPAQRSEMIVLDAGSHPIGLQGPRSASFAESPGG